MEKRIVEGFTRIGIVLGAVGGLLVLGGFYLLGGSFGEALEDGFQWALPVGISLYLPCVIFAWIIVGFLLPLPGRLIGPLGDRHVTVLTCVVLSIVQSAQADEATFIDGNTLFATAASSRADTEGDANAVTLVPGDPDLQDRLDPNSSPPPVYPRDAQLRNQSGVVVVLIHVATTGMVLGVDILQSTGFASLDAAAVSGVKKWHLRPLIRNGQTIPFNMPFRFVFEPDDAAPEHPGGVATPVPAPESVPASDEGLTFRFKQFDFRRLNMGMPQLVYASGVIKAGDLARLTAFIAENAVGRGAALILDSPGGNVVEAMAMARYIRSVGMDTSVGARPTVPGEGVSQPGGCYSACTLLFLGGVHRFVGRTSSFGVHRFFWTGEEGGSDAAQILFGQIVSFVKEMGVDPALTVEMSRSGRDEINVLPAPRMAQLGVTTPAFETEWSIEPAHRTFIVHSVTRDPRGEHHVTFTCSTPEKDGHSHAYLLMIAGFDAGGSARAQTVVTGLKKVQIILDGGRFLDLSDQEILGRELIINPLDHRHVDSAIRITPRLLALMDKSTEIGVAYVMSDEEIYAGFTGALTAKAKRDIHGILDSCR